MADVEDLDEQRLLDQVLVQSREEAAAARPPPPGPLGLGAEDGVALPAVAATGAASPGAVTCPKCQLSHVATTPSGSLFQFDCRARHKCCRACAYDYAKAQLSGWELPQCPFGCTDTPLCAGKVEELVGSEPEPMEAFNVLKMSMAEPSAIAAAAIAAEAEEQQQLQHRWGGGGGAAAGADAGGGAGAASQLGGSNGGGGGGGGGKGDDGVDAGVGVGPVVDADGNEEFEDECMGCGRDDLRKREVFQYGCDQQHFLCLPCARKKMTTDVDDRKRPCCPANCGHTLTPDEIARLCCSREELRRLRAALAEIDLKGFMAEKIASNSEIGCPQPGCPGYMENLRPSVRTRLMCPECRHSICNHCKGPYHIKLCCAEVGPTTDRWLQWVMNDRAKYMRMYRDLEEHQSKFAEEHEEARKRADELKLDEHWKMSHCKLCPHCGKVVNKQDGCNQMVCGTDAADKGGGNKQDGCGKTFNWGTAPAYEVGADEKFLPPSFQECVAQIQKLKGDLSEAEHYVSQEESLKAVRLQMAKQMRKLQAVIAKDSEPEPLFITCQNCQLNIRGPRFSCVHCWLELCVDCERQVSERHVKIEGHEPGHHVMQIHFSNSVL